MTDTTVRRPSLAQNVLPAKLVAYMQYIEQCMAWTSHFYSIQCAYPGQLIKLNVTALDQHGNPTSGFLQLTPGEVHLLLYAVPVALFFTFSRPAGQDGVFSLHCADQRWKGGCHLQLQQL